MATADKNSEILRGKAHAVFFAAAGVLLGASAAMAEMVMLPSDLPTGTEGVAYDSDKDPCFLHLEEEKGIALDVDWWSVAQFKLDRESNTFASLGGTRDWFDGAISSLDENGRLPLELGFDFPIAGVTFSQVAVGVKLPELFCGSGKGGPEFSVSLGEVAWNFGCLLNPADGIFVNKGTTTDNVKFAMIKWVGHDPDNSSRPFNFAVTLYADGQVRFSYGTCGDPNDVTDVCTLGYVAVSGGDGMGNYCYWEFGGWEMTISSSLEDIVFSPSSLPKGMELIPCDDGKHARLTGAPLEAGTFPFRVEAGFGKDTTFTQDYTLTVEASAFPKPILQGFAPDADSGIEVPVNSSQVFSVNVDANGDDPLTFRWFVNDEVVDGQTGASFTFSPTTDDCANNRFPRIVCVVSSAHWENYIRQEWFVMISNPIYPSGSTALNATVNVPFEQQLSATGGSGNYTFSLVPYYNVTRSASTYDDSGTRIEVDCSSRGGYNLSASEAGIPAFKFLGQAYEAVNVNPNGMLYFGPDFPYAGNFRAEYITLAPLGTYSQEDTGTVSYQKFADGVAIFWNKFRDNDVHDPLNASVRFYNDGRIVLSYGTVGGGTDDYPWMTVGYSDGDYAHGVILCEDATGASLSQADDFVLTPALPAGLSLTADGLLSGTVTGNPGAYPFDVQIGDNAGNLTTAHYTLTVGENANAKPVLVSATPEEENVTTYFEHEYEFTAVGEDPEGGIVSYRWEVEGYEPYSYGGHATNESTFVFVPALAAGQRTLKLYLSDNVWSDVLVKTWTLSIGEGPIEIVSDGTLEATADEYFDADGQFAIIGGGGLADVEWEGDLPRNVTITYDRWGLAIQGMPRDPGDYVFTLRVSGNDDSVAEKTFTLSVGGEFTKRNWYVDADSGTWDGDGRTPETAVRMLMNLEDEPISEGDELYLMGSDTEFASHELLDVFEIIHAVPNGNKSMVQVCVQTSAPAEWTGRAVVESGAGMTLNLNEDLDARYYCGGLYRVASLPESWQNEGFNVISSDSHVDGVPVYEDGWVCLRIIGSGSEDRDEYHRGSLTIRYPDDDTRKEYELVDWNRASVVEIMNEGALPQTLSITGNVHISSYSDDAMRETHTIVRRGSVVDLTYGTIAFGWLVSGKITVEPNVRFIVDPTQVGHSQLFRIVNGKSGLDLPQDGLTLELSKPMEAQNNDYGWQVIEGYVGNGHEFTLATPAGDSPANYRFEARDGGLWLVRVHKSSGVYSPKETNPTVVASGYGDQEDYRFYVHQSGDAYGVEYRCLMPYYSVSEDTRRTFDGSKGQKIFRYCDGNTQVHPATVELEFRFPLGGVYYDRVELYSRCAMGFDQHQDSSKFLLQILGGINVPDEPYDLMAIDSSADHFTVRWGDICSATLTPDGKVRVAYGPLADDYESLEVTRATRFRCLSDPYGYEFETDAVYDRYWDNTYAGANDVVFTPTGRPQGISCSVDVPGSYSYPITRFDSDGSRGPTWNFDVTVEYPPVSNQCPKLVSWSPNCVDFVRMRAGEQRDFWVSSDGCQGVMRQFIWKDAEQNVLKEECIDMGTSSLRYSPSSAAIRSGRDQISCTVYSVVKIGSGEDVRYVSVAVRSITRTWNVQIGRDFYFDAVNGSDDGDGSATNPYRDFYVPRGTFSLSDLTDTDRLILAPGTYRTPIDLRDRVRIEVIGSGAANTVIDLDGNQSGFSQYENIFDASAGGVIRVPCTNSVVSGVTFANCADNHYIDPLYGLEEPDVVRGGGALGGVFENCVFSNCTAGVRTSDLGQGGAAFGAVLKNCLLTECCATQHGGGASNCELWNCTVVNCWAGEAAGGIDGTCRAYNTILWYNTVNGEPSNFDKTRRSEMLTDDIPVLKYCCSDADPFGSEGMLVVEHPHLTWNHRLGSQSPCAQAGSLTYAPNLATDLDGNPRTTTEGVKTSISIGAFEFPELPDTEKVRVYLNIDGDGEFANLSYPIVGTDPVYGSYAVCPVVGSPLTFGITGRAVEEFYVDGQPQPVPTEFSFAFDRQTALFFVMPGRTYYVDANGGDDANTGLDWENALATLGEARSRVVGRDAIMLKPGTYDPVDFTGFKGRLTIGTTGSAADTIIDAKQSGRCFTADEESDIVVTGLSFVNGHTEESLNGVGGGVCGGTFVDCVISNCYGYVYGGGAYKATLIRCSVSHNTCDCIYDSILITKFGNSGNSWGGGIAVCTADDCLIWANDARGYADDYVHGSGCSASDVRNSFIWGNKVNGVNDPDESNQYIGNGLVGYSVHNELHRPAEGERESRPTPVMPGTVLPGYYETAEEAMAAAVGKSVDIPADVANALKLNEFAATQAKYSDYTDMFMFVPYPVKKPVQKTMLKSALIPDAYELRLDLKPDVKAEIIADIGKSVQEIPIVTLGKTQMTYQINDTKPGLYYAVEFTESLGWSFEGRRFMALGGSVDVEVEYTDSSSGFWRIGVYLTPTGP